MVPNRFVRIADTKLNQGFGSQRDAVRAAGHRPESEYKIFRRNACRQLQFFRCDCVAHDSGNCLHALHFTVLNNLATIFGGLLPHAIQPENLFKMEIFRITLDKQFGRPPDGHHPEAGRVTILRRPVKHVGANLLRLDRQRDDDFFLALEVVIDGALGILQFSSDGVHFQSVITVSQNHRAGNVQNPRLPLGNLLLLRR